MKKFCRVVFTIFVVLLILYLLFVAVYLGLSGFNMSTQNGFDTRKASYGVNPLWLPDGYDTVVDDIYALREENGDLDTAYNIYRKACEKLMLAKAYGVRAKSDIDVSAIGLSLTCASNRTEQYYVPGTPTLNANQKVYSSYVNTIYVTEASDPALGTLLKSLVQFATRGYSDGTNSYVQKGSLSAMDGEDEVITWKEGYEPEDLSSQRTYKDDEIRDKCNFIVSKQTILPDSVKIERTFDEEANMYLYHIVMDLDCTDKTETGATYYETKAIKDLLGANMKSLVYSQMKIDMTLYSNGYLITWDTLQEWTLVYNAKIIELSGTALNKKYELFSYRQEDCEVVDFTK